MSQSKESPPKKDRTFEVSKDLEGLDKDQTFEVSKTSKVEFDSCYRGKIEIWKDGNGKVVSYKIIR